MLCEFETGFKMCYFFELESATKIIRILREEIVSDAFEVKNSSNGRLSKNSESRSYSPKMM